MSAFLLRYKGSQDINVSLYRKYRPLDFSGLLGQNHVRDILLGALELDRVSHAISSPDLEVRARLPRQGLSLERSIA